VMLVLLNEFVIKSRSKEIPGKLKLLVETFPVLYGTLKFKVE
jgi:hypothetical protein